MNPITQELVSILHLEPADHIVANIEEFLVRHGVIAPPPPPPVEEQAPPAAPGGTVVGGVGEPVDQTATIVAQVTDNVIAHLEPLTTQLAGALTKLQEAAQAQP